MVYHPTARVLTVLELLQTHGHLSGRELAARLEVDVRTVRRYITTLQDMGIPVDAEIGRYGGYALRPGFKLPPLMFTDDEVLLLTLGLLLARRSGVIDAGAAAERALAKIERVLPHTLRERLRALVETMHLDNESTTEQVTSSTVTVLSVASQQHRTVTLTYAGTEGDTTRSFDPYRVIRYQRRWYTVGYCHLRQALRVFRLDRVREVALQENHFVPPEAFDTVAYMLGSFEAIPDRWDVEVLLEMPLDEARRRVAREWATLTQEPHGVRLQASLADLDETARVLLSLGCPMIVYRPPELRAAFMSLAETAAQIAYRVS